MASRRATRRNPLRARGPGFITVHPTKGFRRISDQRIRAQAKMPHQLLTWALIGAAVR